MTDLVSQLVGALEGMLALDEENHQRYPGDEDVCKEVQAAQAALTAAKAGGWVAVPMTREEKLAAWKAATIELPSPENCYLRGLVDAEAHHGITQRADGAHQPAKEQSK